MIYETLKDENEIANQLSLMGNTYMGFDFNKALEYYERSNIILKKIGDEGNLANNYANIAYIYQYLGDSIKSLQYHKASLKINQKLGIKYPDFLYLKDMGGLIQDAPDSILISLGIKPALRYQTAIKYELQVLKIAEEIKSPTQKASIFLTSSLFFDKLFNLLTINVI